jgi:hypothetical protein
MDIVSAGLEPWLAFYNDHRIVQRSAEKHRNKFLYAAFRVLYFYARCAGKLKLRAKKLFRLEEESIYEMIMPIDRFPGYYQVCFSHQT